jgi:trans-aconitate methyltransferase
MAPQAQGKEYALRFQDQSVVERYLLRAAYPPETFVRLNELIVDEPRAVLDVGCGPGSIARDLVPYVDRIDAVDISQPMLAKARTLPNGASPKIRWIFGRAEDVELQPPYALVTAGRSLHWMDWGVVMPRFRQLLTPHGMLALVHASERDSPWDKQGRELIARYTNNPHPRTINMLAELETHHLFQKQGQQITAPMAQQQTIEEYISGMHSRSSLSLDIMSTEQATQFDSEARELLAPFAQNGLLTVQVVGRIVWGRPLTGMPPEAM